MALGTLSRSGLIIDLFSCSGGASLGISQALGRSPDIAIDLDPVALQTHAEHHPKTQHVCRDIMTVHPLLLTNGRLVSLLWASPVCSGFSQAANGPRCLESRNLAWAVIRWAKLTRPTVIILENVRQFIGWEAFPDWVEQLAEFGYNVDWRCLNAADYGVPQKRKRLLLVARCDGEPIRWPDPVTEVRPARDCIDWNVPCWRLSNRPARLKPISHERVDLGMERFAPEPFLVSFSHGRSMNGPQFMGQSLDRPVNTICSHNSLYLVRADLPGPCLRWLTVREFARMQGFPDWYSFAGAQKDKLRQIGMAVPPAVARVMVGVNVRAV